MEASAGRLVVPSVDQIRRKYAMDPHPEGGWWSPTWRSDQMIAAERGPRPAATSILFLLDQGTRSLWHRLHGSSELWFWQGGAELTLTTAGSGGVPGAGSSTVLGPPGLGEALAVVEPGDWQCAQAGPTCWSLVSCVVSPGFDFDDFELHDTAVAQLE